MKRTKKKPRVCTQPCLCGGDHICDTVLEDGETMCYMHQMAHDAELSEHIAQDQLDQLAALRGQFATGNPIMEALRIEPGSVFEFEAELRGGENKVHGTIGPIINNRLVMQASYLHPPTEADKEIVTKAMSAIIGGPPGVVKNCASEEETAAFVRKFMGGGQG